MILLDTDVVSEPLRRVPENRVIERIDAQPMERLFLSAITVAELRSGVALLPGGKRRSGLKENLEKRLLPLFAGRVLPFDLACTHAYAGLPETPLRSKPLAPLSSIHGKLELPNPLTCLA